MRRGSAARARASLKIETEFLLLAAILVAGFFGLPALKRLSLSGPQPLWTGALNCMHSMSTQLRLYAEGHDGRYPVLDGVSGREYESLMSSEGALDGAYYRAEDFTIDSTPTSFVIRFEANADHGWKQWDAGRTLSLDQDHHLTGTSPMVTGERRPRHIVPNTLIALAVVAGAGMLIRRAARHARGRERGAD